MRRARIFANVVTFQSLSRSDRTCPGMPGSALAAGDKEILGLFHEACAMSARAPGAGCHCSMSRVARLWRTRRMSGGKNRRLVPDQVRSRADQISRLTATAIGARPAGASVCGSMCSDKGGDESRHCEALQGTAGVRRGARGVNLARAAARPAANPGAGYISSWRWWRR